MELIKLLWNWKVLLFRNLVPFVRELMYNPELHPTQAESDCQSAVGEIWLLSYLAEVLSYL